MHFRYDQAGAHRLDAKSSEDVFRERGQSWFIVRKRFSTATDKKYLSFLWLMIEPLVTALIYLFVFTVLRARIQPGSIFIGITLYRVFQSSILAGTKVVNSVDGGITCERVSTNVIIKGELFHRSIESLLATIPTSLILVFGFGINWEGGIFYIFIAQIMAILFLGVGLIFSRVIQKIPDLGAILSWILRLGFFISPAIIPMWKMRGLHFEFNLYNPFAYFSEGTRMIAGETSMFDSFNTWLIVTWISSLTLIAAWAFYRFDNLRWRVSTWS